MTYALIPLLVAAFAVWLGRRLLALVAFFAYLAVEGMLKLMSDYQPVVHVGADLVLLSITAAWVLGATLRGRRGLPRAPLAGLILLHALWVLMLLFHPLTASLFVGLAALKIHLTMIPLYFLAFVVIRSREDAQRALTGLVAVAYLPFALALVQYALGPASVFDLSDRYWQNIALYHEWRPFGTSAVPGGTATFAFLTVPLAVALLLSPDATRRVRWLAVGAVALGAGTFLVAGGRQMLLGCLLALLTMAAIGSGRRFGRAAFVLSLVAVLAGGAYVGVQTFLRPLATEAIAADPRSPAIWRERSVLDRLNTLTEIGTYTEARAGALDRVVSRLRRYPLGAGLGRTGSAGGRLRREMGTGSLSASINREVGFSDNYFADMLSETGVPGTIMLTTIVIGMGLMAGRLARRATDRFAAVLGAAVAGIVFALLVMSWGSQPLLSNPTTAYFWFLAGTVAALRRVALEAREAAAEPTGTGALPPAPRLAAAR